MKIATRFTFLLLCLILCLSLTPTAFADDVVIDETIFLTATSVAMSLRTLISIIKMLI